MPRATARGGQQRGRDRADRIACAAADLLADHHLESVTHRAVATRAGVPLGSTTYYFATRDELLAGGARVLVERQLAASRAVVQGLRPRAYGDRAVASRIVDVLLERDDDAWLLAYYDRLLAAGRRPLLQQILRELRFELLSLVDAVLQRCGRPGAVPADRVLVVVDGTVLGALSEGREGARRHAETAVIELLAAAPASRVSRATS